MNKSAVQWAPNLGSSDALAIPSSLHRWLHWLGLQGVAIKKKLGTTAVVDLQQHRLRSSKMARICTPTMLPLSATLPSQDGTSFVKPATQALFA